jgi:flagellar biosynthetic protein FliQ
MTPEFVIDICRESIKTTILLAGPLLGAGLLIGLLVSIFQAVTQIHEMTLTFIPKILAVVITLIIFLPWMMKTILDFTTNLITHIPDYIR